MLSLNVQSLLSKYFNLELQVFTLILSLFYDSFSLSTDKLVVYNNLCCHLFKSGYFSYALLLFIDVGESPRDRTERLDGAQRLTDLARPVILAVVELEAKHREGLLSL